MRRLLPALALLLAAAPAAADPLEMVNGRLFVPATVNGRPVTALLDSGAEMSILDDDFARRLGLAGSGSAVARGSGAATMEARFAEGLRVEALGDSAVQTAAILDLGEVSARLIGRNLDFILGREAFDRARLRIDIEGGRIDRLGPEDRPAGARLALGEHRGTPTIEAEVEGQGPVQAVFDLGNGSGVLVGRAFAERTGLAAPGRVTGRRSGGGLGGSLDRDTILLARLVVAGREFRDVPAAIDDTENAADLNLGTSVLRHFLITTDFPARAVWLEPR